MKTPEEALEGARAILVEQFSEKAELIGVLRENFWTRGRIVSKVRDGKAQEGAKYSRLFRFLRAADQIAVASHPGAVPRREGGNPRSGAGAGKRGRRGRRRAKGAYERAIAASVGVADRGRPGRQMADGLRPLGLAHAHQDFARRRSARAAVAATPRIRRSRCSPAICATCCWPRPPGRAPTMGLDPGFRTGVKVAVVDATGKVVDTGVIYPHEPQRRWDDALLALGAAVPPAQGRADRHRQRHGLARDRQAGRRTGRQAARTEDDQDRGVGGRGLGLFGLGLRRGRIARPRRDPARRRLDRAAACRTRWPNWSRSTRNRSASASTSTISRNSSCRARSTRWWRIASTGSASISTPPPRRCWRGFPASAPIWPPMSSRIATPTGRSARATRLKKVPRLGAKAFEQCAGFLRIRGGDEPARRLRRASRSLSAGAQDSRRDQERHPRR